MPATATKLDAAVVWAFLALGFASPAQPPPLEGRFDFVTRGIRPIALAGAPPRRPAVDRHGRGGITAVITACAFLCHHAAGLRIFSRAWGI